MNKIYWLAIGLSLGWLTIACGGGNNKVTSENESIEDKTVVTEPISDVEQKVDMSINLGNHVYQVIVKRVPDKSLPLVVDELEQRFYDNSVELTILKDHALFLQKKITKALFSKYLSENDYQSGLLLGMNCDTARCDKSTLCFTAQVGQAGEGPAFLVLVPTNGGDVRVMCDNALEEIGYKP